MQSKWFSPRAFLIHLALIVWLSVCALCAWWQVGRAAQGNSISFFYAIEWPVFGILGVLGWYALLNVERVQPEREAERRAYEERMRAEARAARELAAENEDPQLAAYNDHLANLATKPKKRFGAH